MTTCWNEYNKSILLTKKNGNILIIKVGDCIIHDLRSEPIRIDKFTGKEEVMGVEYLPWRGARWATPTISLRGNPRHIICIPGGISHYGQHIDWETVEVVPTPEIFI